MKNLASLSLRCLLLSALSLTALSPLANAKPWEPDSDPFTVNRNYSAFFAELPLSAQLPDSERPWSGPYWADKKGSIGLRWQSGERPWDYKVYSPEAAKELKSDEIAKLSPAEKFDLLRGEYTFPILKDLQSITGKSKKLWYGICTGWAQASLHFDQPKPITLAGPNGQLIPFGSGDIKALASYYYAFPGEEDRVTARIGTRCDRGDDKRDCKRDVNAGALHIMLANRLGLEKKGLFADMAKGIQVWQHPIYGFSSRALGERSPRKDASPLAVKEVHVKTTLNYAKETDATWEVNSIREKTRHLNYWLEIDADGQIVGGKYTLILGGRVPDYVWISEPLTFSHGWELLSRLITSKGTSPVPSKNPEPVETSDEDTDF